MADQNRLIIPFICFIDYDKDFDRVSQNKLFKNCETNWVGNSIINIIISLNENQDAGITFKERGVIGPVPKWPIAL